MTKYLFAAALLAACGKTDTTDKPANKKSSDEKSKEFFKKTAVQLAHLQLESIAYEAEPVAKATGSVPRATAPLTPTRDCCKTGADPGRCDADQAD